MSFLTPIQNIHPAHVVGPKEREFPQQTQPTRERAHLCVDVAVVTGLGHVVDILPARHQPRVHIGHFALHELHGTEDEIHFTAVKTSHFNTPGSKGGGSGLR